MDICGNSRAEVKGIGTCKLVMRSDQTLFLHDVLFAPEICRNSIFVFILLKHDFELHFHGQGVDLFLAQAHLWLWLNFKCFYCFGY